MSLYPKGKYDIEIKGGPAKKDRHELDAMRYALDELIGKLDPRARGDFTDVSTLFDKDVVDAVKAKKIAEIEKLQKEISDIESVEESINTLQFKVGDVAFHQELGNVLVQGIVVENIDNVRTLKYNIMNTKARRKVDINEVLPITSATKLLYGK